ncbi:MAG: alpha/beta hydrolase family protein [Niabella sp.]
MRKAIFFICLVVLSTFSSKAQDDIAYKKPPELIEKLVMANFNPAVDFNEDGSWMMILQRSTAPTVEDLAQPELRIAGLRINPANFSQSRSSYYTGIAFKNVATGKEFPVTGLPANLKILEAFWNPAGNKVALVQEGRFVIDLYLIDTKNFTAKKINKTPLNFSTDFFYTWIDDETMMYYGTTAPASAMPAKPVAPSGPVVQQNLGKVAASRTYQDLIKNKYDEELYRFYAKKQLIINKNGVERKINKPDYYQSVSASPDKKYLLVTKQTGQLSYLVPYYGFTANVEVWNQNGTFIKKLATVPSMELAPSGFDNVLNAPRNFEWIDTKPHTIGWTLPLDSGYIKKDIPYHDAYVTVDAPFSATPATTVKTPMRLRGVQFITEDKALVTQGSYAKQQLLWQLLDVNSGVLTTISDRSMNDAYADIGTPFQVRNQFGRYVPLLLNKSTFIMRGRGASPQGEYPFVSYFDVNTKQQEIIWQCQDPFYEAPVKLLAYNNGVKFVTSRQSNTAPPNYYTVDIANNSTKAITQFPDPQEALRNLKMEKIQYKRKDGISLTANLYVNKNYNPKKDDRLPVIIVAYPREYKSAADATQVRGSKNTFTLTSYASFVPFALLGYAVMDNTEFPIVGEDDKYPNDNFVEQLEWNAKAAIEKIAEMGIGDSTRVAVAGHSYGAFMTANLLAHTQLFKAGIARSGAYNRTLTPFGFQNEERTYWQAPQVYFKMSPFSYADKIKTPLLLVHGEADNNPGTFPIQSERLFNAIKGHGGTVRLVQLPFESHGYAAKESRLHLLWEEYEWLEKYLKKIHTTGEK